MYSAMSLLGDVLSCTNYDKSLGDESSDRVTQPLQPCVPGRDGPPNAPIAPSYNPPLCLPARRGL